MKFLLWGIVLSLVLSIISVGFWFYQFKGLKYYIKAVVELNTLPNSEKKDAFENFYGIDDNRTYSGTLSEITGDNKIGVWGKRGLVYFKTDQFSNYSFFNACNEENFKALDNKEEISIGQNVYSDIGLWKQKIKTGDYVIVLITREGNGGISGNLREVWAYDWWGTFLPSIDLIQQCQKGF